MISQTQSRAALRQSEIQRLKYKVKEINISLIRLVAERKLLVQKLKELGDEPDTTPKQPRTQVVQRPPPPPEPPIVKKRKLKPVRGKRRTVFTDEVLALIPLYIEEGLDREKIAARIGCTMNSLQATCSRKGISLWRKDRTRKRQVVYQYEYNHPNHGNT